MFDDFYDASIEMGQEYYHWIDLRLIKLMEVVIFKIHLTNIIFCQNGRFFVIKQQIQKGT